MWCFVGVVFKNYGEGLVDLQFLWVEVVAQLGDGGVYIVLMDVGVNEQ